MGVSQMTGSGVDDVARPVIAEATRAVIRPSSR